MFSRISFFSLSLYFFYQGSALGASSWETMLSIAPTAQIVVEYEFPNTRDSGCDLLISSPENNTECIAVYIRFSVCEKLRNRAESEYIASESLSYEEFLGTTFQPLNWVQYTGVF